MLATSITRPSPRRNRFLASLPDTDLRALEPQLEFVALPLGKQLCQPGEQLKRLYFPTDGAISVVHTSANGQFTELALVGAEGLLGGVPLLGRRTWAYAAIVQIAGHAYRLPAQEATARFDTGGPFQRLVLRQVHDLVTQLTQVATCNMHHSLEQQLSRRLLLCLDRAPGNELAMTHDMIARMLGVRRQGITEAANRLERRGALCQSRGRITVVDRLILERCACECYAAVRDSRELPLSDRLHPRAEAHPALLRWSSSTG